MDDPTQYNAIKKTVLRYTDDAWQVHLPEGHCYELKLVTRGITGINFPPPDARHNTGLDPGLHHIEIRRERDQDKNNRFLVLVDEEIRFEAQETPDWNESGGSSAAEIGKTQAVLPTNQPLVLNRLRVSARQPDGSSRSSPPNEAVNGVLLWITAQERTPESPPPGRSRQAIR